MFEREYRKEKNRRRRELQIRRRLRILKISVPTFFLVLLLFFTVNSLTSHAQSNTAVHSYKYYTSILIRSGDTLWGIAETYKRSPEASGQDYIREVMQMNHLTETKLTAGEYLIVPYYSAEFF